MFIVFLRFSQGKSRAPELMAAHNAWIAKGFEEGVFLTAGSLRPAGGGAVLASGISREELEARIGEDPFVSGDVVRPEIYEIDPARTDPRLDFIRG